MPEEPPLSVSASRHFMEWLHESRLSLGFTTYQTNRLFLVGVKPEGRLSVFERLFERVMGLYATKERLTLSTRYQIWQLDDALPPGGTHNGYDRLYVPRRAYTTGDLDVHDIAVGEEGRLVFANTMYSCLATISERYSFRPLWKPPFISRLAPEDRCHLNGLAMAAGKPAYVTTVSRSDVSAGWRERRHTGGCVIDVESGEIVTDQLSMPHSPRVYGERLYVLNSGTGEFGYVDRQAGRFEPIAFCPGYLRGLAFHGDHAIVGLSKQRRERTFSGLALDDRLREKDTDARCGLWVIDLRTGNVAHWVELEGVVIELYDVVVLPDTTRPMALGFKTSEIQRLITIEEESGPRFEPVRTSEGTPGAEPGHGGAAPPSSGRGEGHAPAAPAPPQYRQASELARAGRNEEARALYEEGLRAEPRHVDTYVSLGTVHYRLGNPDKARRCWEEALQINPRSAGAHANLARALSDEGDVDGAIGHWNAVITVDPKNSTARLELATLLSAVGRLGDARGHLEQVVRSDPENGPAWNALGAVLSLEQRDAEALQHFERAAEVSPDLFEAHLNRGNASEALGETERAREAYGRALAVREEPVLALRRELLCPPVFGSVHEIEAYAERAQEAIERVAPEGLRVPLAQVQFLRAEVPFNWAYQGRDYLSLRRAYAALFTESLHLPPLAARVAPEPPWRVGFVVTATHEGVFLRCMAGILEQLDRSRFHVAVVCPRAALERVRRSLRCHDVALVELPQRFDHAVAALREGHFDALYFWEVGTDATNYFLPFCRLAPVQCTGWGWPETAAAPELDYHLTSEGLAPLGAERLFAERLVRLEHLPAYMQRPPGVRWQPESLGDLGLSDDANLYLCVQSLRKVHPDMDALLGGILRADPDAVVAFVHDRSPTFGEMLRRRWEETLEDVQERAVLLPRRSADGYVRLLASADVLLDTPHFGGANTAYDAYLAGVPMVTLPGEAPRSRYTAALHEAAGIEGCTAGTPEEYVSLSVRLGTDPRWRTQVSTEMVARVPRLFERPEPAAQLASFLEDAIRRAPMAPGSAEARASSP